MSINVKGKVVKGLHIGAKIGYPTINIQAAACNVEFGVYICEIKINKIIYKGVLHYGPKTIGAENPGEIYCEAHIFNFDRDVYNKEVEIKLLKKIRDVRKFRTEEELKKQISKDIKITKKYFNA